MKVGVAVTGKEDLLRGLEQMKLRAGQKPPLFADAGHYMTFTAIPLIFRQSGPGWPSVKRGGKPLIDTGLLRSSISYTASSSDVVVGSRLKSARLHNEGGQIVPRKAKMLAIPLSPPLSVSEARTKGPRDFRNTFIYKHLGKLFIMQRLDSKGGKSYKLRAIFMLLKSVRIKPRTFLLWRPEHLKTIGDRWARHIMKGNLEARPLTGGQPNAFTTDPRRAK